ncbi:hypothetical protein [Endothiovibrio diazotrophicus]
MGTRDWTRAQPPFSGRMGGGLDPCAAVQVGFALAAREQREITFLRLPRPPGRRGYPPLEIALANAIRGAVSINHVMRVKCPRQAGPRRRRASRSLRR